MRRILASAAACILMGMLGAYLMNNNIPEKAWAGVTCTLPVILQNGTTADATQVMQNFNQLAGCFTNVATVSQVTCGPGLDGGIISSTGTCSLSSARRTLPTVQAFLGGSGLYTTPLNALWLKVIMVGGGGGGGGGATGGGTGGNTTFSTSTAGGGAGSQGQSSPAGGAASTCTIGIAGSAGATGNGATIGGSGGASFFGGSGGSGVGSGTAGAANSGSGGGGAGAANGYGGGGSGAYCELLINNPAATYSYSVGAGGTAPASGGTGASGIIYVYEYYGT